MTSLIVITFDDVEEAAQARSALNDMQKQGRLKIEDSAVIVKDEEGKVKVHGQASSDAVTGGLVGGGLGLLLGMVFFPLGALAIGAVGGALIGHSLGRNVDKKFVQDVEEAMKPGTSALFVLMEHVDQTAELAALRQFKGTLYHSNLDPETEQALRDAIKSPPAPDAGEV